MMVCLKPYFTRLSFVLSFVAMALAGSNIAMAQQQAALIQPNEFENAVLRGNTSCSITLDALYVIERLGQFDANRFGANSLLRQITDYGCVEHVFPGTRRDGPWLNTQSFVIVGKSRQDIVEEAQRILETDPPPKLRKTQAAPQRAAEDCGPPSFDNVDHLGVLLYFYAVANDTPHPKSPLEYVYEDMSLYCLEEFLLNGEN